jgi:replication-associated recombination protein RarA
LDEVVGQPAVIRRLKQLVASPQPCCLLFEGLGGVGKSAAAKALIQDLGVCPFSGLVEYSASNLTMEEVRRLFGQTFRLRPMTGSPWHVLLVEELELIVSRNVSAALKDELSEQHMPERLIVVATSNDASGLNEALLQRFDVFPFSAGPTFAVACHERLAWIWEQEAGAGVPMPLGMEQMGWRNGNYSMRRAMTALGGALELRCGEGVAV